MISPVSMSGVPFRAAETNNVLNRKGAFTKDDVNADFAPKKKKKGGFKKFLIGVLVAAAALVTLNKTNVLKVLSSDALKDASIFKKVGHYLSKAGEFIGKYTVDLAVKGWNKVFKKA